MHDVSTSLDAFAHSMTHESHHMRQWHCRTYRSCWGGMGRETKLEGVDLTKTAPRHEHGRDTKQIPPSFPRLFSFLSPPRLSVIVVVS